MRGKAICIQVKGWTLEVKGQGMSSGMLEAKVRSWRLHIRIRNYTNNETLVRVEYASCSFRSNRSDVVTSPRMCTFCFRFVLAQVAMSRFSCRTLAILGRVPSVTVSVFVSVFVNWRSTAARQTDLLVLADVADHATCVACALSAICLSVCLSVGHN